MVNNPRDPNTTHWSRRIFNTEWFYKFGITYSDVSSGDPAFRFQRQGVIFSGRGPMIISNDYSLLAFLNSKVAKETLKLIAPTLTFNIGDILKLPYSQEKSILMLVQLLVFLKMNGIQEKLHGTLIKMS